jgi:hypothetical protein
MLLVLRGTCTAAASLCVYGAKKQAVDSGAIPALVKLLSSAEAAIRKQAAGIDQEHLYRHPQRLSAGSDKWRSNQTHPYQSCHCLDDWAKHING